MTYIIQVSDLLNYLPVTQGSPAKDTAIMQDAVDWAEATFTGLAASRFDQATESLVQPGMAWVDRHGEITLQALERGPVTAVSRVQYRLVGQTSWFDLVWTSDSLFLPSVRTPPVKGSWTVSIQASNFSYRVVSPDDWRVRWSYTGGYATLPNALQMLLLRLAAWKYRLREAPLGRISSEMFGTREVIPELPKDLNMDILRWQRGYV